MLLLLAALGGAADELAPVEIVTTKGQRLVCWRAAEPTTGLDGPVDLRIQVGERAVWRAQRCLEVPDSGWLVGQLGQPGQAAAPAGALRLHGRAREAALLPDDVQSVALGSDGALWLARCRSGVTRLHPQQHLRQTWTEGDGVPTGCVTKVVAAADGSAWVLTPTRAAHLDPSSGVVDIQAFDEQDRASVASIFVGSQERVWLGGQGGRLRGLFDDPDVRTRYDGAMLGALDTIEHIAAGEGDTLWLSSRDRLTQVDPRRGTFSVRVSHGAQPGLPPGRPGPVVHAADGDWVVVRGDRPDDPSGGLVRLAEKGFLALNTAGVPDRPLAVSLASDDALWVTDADGLVRVSPDRQDVRRIAVRRGFVPAGPWVQPGSSGQAWAAVRGDTTGTTLSLFDRAGVEVETYGPTPLPPRGKLVREDEGVLLATANGFWRLNTSAARWEPHPGFGDALAGTTPQRLSVIRTDSLGRTWVAGRDGLRMIPRAGAARAIEIADSGEIYDVHPQLDGTVLVAAENGLYAHDRVGRVLRVVDDGGRALVGVERLVEGPNGDVWAWGPAGAWTVLGSDAVRRSGSGIRDLVTDADAVWIARADGVRRLVDGRFERVALPRQLAGPQQLAVRGGELVWVRTSRGLWRAEDDKWRRAVGVDGPFERSRDGTLWRWDPDGLHVLPADARTWRWVGLDSRPPRDESDESAPIAAGAVAVHALAGVLAVEVEGVVVGEPERRDPIVDLDVRGTRWAALSRRGVLLRGDGYRLLEQSYAPGPARKVALGPHQVCVAGTTVWCRTQGQWRTVLDVLDLPAPVPAVDLDVDDQGRMWSLHPGALCRQGRGCRGIPGISQTSLLVQGEQGWIGALSGLYQITEAGRATLVRAGAPVLDLARGSNGSLWLATDGQGVIEWKDGDLRVVRPGAGPVVGAPTVTRRVAMTDSGHLWVRQGADRWVLPGPTMRLARWPWARTGGSSPTVLDRAQTRTP